MRDENLISIIIPVYNNQDLLDRCFESVVNQTYRQLQIIVIDDGSTDRSCEICREWAERDERIELYHIPNGGVANARNYALEKVKGAYVGFIDSDDYAETELYEVLKKHIDAYGADVSVCGYFRNDKGSSSEETRTLAVEEALKSTLMGKYECGVLWNKLYRFETVQGITMPDYKCCEDLIYNYLALKNVRTIVETKRCLYHYCDNAASITNSQFNVGALDAVKAKELMLSEHSDDAYRPYAIYGLIDSCMVLLSGVIRNRMEADFFKPLRKRITANRYFVYRSSLFSKSAKLKTLLITCFPAIYRYLIRRYTS